MAISVKIQIFRKKYLKMNLKNMNKIKRKKLIIILIKTKKPVMIVIMKCMENIKKMSVKKI